MLFFCDLGMKRENVLTEETLENNACADLKMRDDEEVICWSYTCIACFLWKIKIKMIRSQRKWAIGMIYCLVASTSNILTYIFPFLSILVCFCFTYFIFSFIETTFGGTWKHLSPLCKFQLYSTVLSTIVSVLSY